MFGGAKTAPANPANCSDVAVRSLVPAAVQSSSVTCILHLHIETGGVNGRGFSGVRFVIVENARPFLLVQATPPAQRLRLYPRAMDLLIEVKPLGFCFRAAAQQARQGQSQRQRRSIHQIISHQVQHVPHHWLASPPPNEISMSLCQKFSGSSQQAPQPRLPQGSSRRGEENGEGREHDLRWVQIGG